MSIPMPSPANCSTRFSKELKPHGTEQASSPASMRAFNRSSNAGSGDGNTTVSPTSVIAFEDGAGRSNDAGEFSSEEHSHELRNLHGVKESSDFNDSNWAFTDSLLSLDFESSSQSSAKNADFNDEREYACDVKRAPIHTFTVNNDDVDGDGNRNEALVDECEPVKPAPVTKGNKGLCYRCFKGSRFTEKEVCLVCSAKYCGNCVLDAMGSMPEGRKCVDCIGYPIDESKRESLGKCSRIFRRLLNELEVRQIMKAERFCEVNQLPPEYICVNGRPLSFEELVTLQNCAAPPKKLKPGSYWYDKVSGLWGEEGRKPCRIISPHLNVGGPIKPDASNGNTQVYINGREITTVELRMLQLAGVQCAGNPHFWVNEDGSYQEEGQKNIRGNIWGKSGTKLVCALLSLPVPSKCSILCGERTSSPVSKRVPDYLEHGIVHKLLLVGYGGSGTSTIFKQAKILYKDIPFSKEERESIKLTIQTNVYSYIGLLLEGRERFEEESLWNMKKRQSDVLDSSTGVSSNNKTIYSIGTRLKAFSDWLLRTMASGKLDAIFPAATREYAPLIEEMWSSAAIKATYKRRREIEMLPSVASYFLERVVEILRADYEPSDLDILYAEGVTSSNGLACVEFSFPPSAPEETVDTIGLHDSFARYQLITAHARGIGENCKWLEMLEDVGMVVFSVALSDYDQFSAEGNGCITNKMLSSRKLFETIVTHPTFEKMDFLLILNKLDQFEEKIKQVPLTRCEWFADFHPVISRQCSGNNKNSINNNSSLAQLASHHIAVKFKRLYSSITGRKLYVSLVKGLEPDSVDAALKYAREIVKWNQERLNFSLSDNSMYSTEDSSFSFTEC
ncbi:extra-large guanine nucleotide-binding protein 1-like [Arachis stenosperma]|uniref:extra-large guanine nucleotide-binding protein 1-like n=1 Tax=Arachis stenosperma TaxID=217475 RepID=UPI0025AC06A8|nr:extra-large guanine nucleotide-binding protein 1-like [Arachis stenosperma]